MMDKPPLAQRKRIFKTLKRFPYGCRYSGVAWIQAPDGWYFGGGAKFRLVGFRTLPSEIVRVV